MPVADGDVARLRAEARRLFVSVKKLGLDQKDLSSKLASLEINVALFIDELERRFPVQSPPEG